MMSTIETGETMMPKKWWRRTPPSVVWNIVFLVIGVVSTLFIESVTHNKYETQRQTELLQNAIHELDYNYSISWYNDPKFLDNDQYWSLLRTQALWEVYYNRKSLWPKDEAVHDYILSCLEETDWINRLVPAQYSPIQFVTSSRPDVKQQDLANQTSAQGEAILKPLHKDMQERYKSKVKPKMNQLRKYLEAKLETL